MPCLTPFYIDYTDKISGEVCRVLVPCGKCEGCLKKKQSDWIARLMVECQMCLSSFFITLTYDEKHLPFPDGVSKEDAQHFFRRFKKLIGCEYKYFLVSEYGSVSSRPHMHFLLFFPDKVDWITLSYILQDSWKLGQHKIGTVDMASISYVAKYCLKSRKDPRNIYRNPTFSLMSKANGKKLQNSIGYALLEVLLKYRDREIFEVVSGDRVVSMPRYYRDKVFDDLAKFNHVKNVQEKYNSPEYLLRVLDANERCYKRVAFERKQRSL